MIDSHCHLDFKQLRGRLDDIIDEAVSVGVHTIVNIGVDLPASIRSINLAERYDMIYASVGVHPHDASTLDRETLIKLKDMAAHDKVVAIGEIGLDYYRDLSPRKVQKQAFRKQLELAVELKMPVVIHTREAFRDTVEIVNDYVSDLVGGVFHCFPGSAEDAEEVFAMGFIISVGGVITYNNSRMSQMASHVPLDKIILETDAPFLTPVPLRGKTNQPAYVKHTCKKLAELQGVSETEVEKITDRTCQKLYRLVETFGD
ncbi:MAG: TatD family hydrolase [candidate division Zixibacteria bacterium]|nr:TatD family hydrolase [candidate division Zixibacteria bacterium]